MGCDRYPDSHYGNYQLIWRNCTTSYATFLSPLEYPTTSNWFKLDKFEGEAYERVLTKAKLNDGSFVDAYVYALKRG